MALVEWADNIAISDDAPPVYWPAQVAAKQITGDRLAQQMYWHALPDGWEQLEYTDFLPRRRRLMAEVVRDAFTRLHDSGYQPVYPQVAPPAAEPATRTWTAYGVRVVDLIDADLLPAGTQLVSTRSTVDAIATVLPDGKIAYDDEVYDTPSAAAVAARDASANGWTFWAADTPDGRFTLAALRDLYMQQRSS
jgi:Restriction Enzyme Adenine Methylase Associated